MYERHVEADGCAFAEDVVEGVVRTWRSKKEQNNLHQNHDVDGVMVVAAMVAM